MNHFNPESDVCPRVLASDLDGTLIPLPDSPENERDLIRIKSALSDHPIEIVFATGRHLASVVEAMATYGLPTPDWVVCDVGSAIYHYVEGDYQPYSAYRTHLHQRQLGPKQSPVGLQPCLELSACRQM